MLWLVYALSSAILFALTALLSRVISVNSTHPRAYSVIFGLSSSVCVLFLFLIEPFSFRPVSGVVLGLTVISTICYGLGDRLTFTISKSIEASLLTIIDKLTPIVTFVASLIFLGEGFTLRKLVAVILILLGNLLVVYKSTVIKFDKAFFLALFVAACVGIGLTIDKRISIAYALPVYAFINFFMPTLYNTFLPPLPFRTIAQQFKVAFWRITLLAAMNVLGYYFVLKAFSLADASRVVPIMSSSTILIVLAGILFLKERSQLGRKIIAGLCVCIGVVLIGV
jgi:drug/metabolite transporter (DMT)-like permease